MARCAARLGTRAAFDLVPADRVEGAMLRLPAPRFGDVMPARPVDDGAKVAGRPLPRYERAAPEIAEVPLRAVRPGV